MHSQLNYLRIEDFCRDRAGRGLWKRWQGPSGGGESGPRDTRQAGFSMPPARTRGAQRGTTIPALSARPAGRARGWNGWERAAHRGIVRRPDGTGPFASRNVAGTGLNMAAAGL